MRSTTRRPSARLGQSDAGDLRSRGWRRIPRTVTTTKALSTGFFSTPWLVHYLDAQAHATGEDLYDRPGFRLMYNYVAHSMLPGGNYVF